MENVFQEKLLKLINSEFIFRILQFIKMEQKSVFKINEINPDFYIKKLLNINFNY